MTTEKFTQQAAASAKPGSAGPLPMEAQVIGKNFSGADPEA
jgi:hypothetical protein